MYVYYPFIFISVCRDYAKGTRETEPKQDAYGQWRKETSWCTFPSSQTALLILKIQIKFSHVDQPKDKTAKNGDLRESVDGQYFDISVVANKK